MLKAALFFQVLDLISIQSNKTDNSSGKTSQRRVNFYVVNKPKTLDLFSRLVVVRARKKE